MINFMHALAESCSQVEAALEDYFHVFSSRKGTLIQAMRYSTLSGGKRLRPFLVYQTGRLFGLMPVNLNAPASAIECIHCYSMIHDDLPVMDNSIVRRGKPACHVKFGENTAILAGDALQTLAFKILADAEMPGVSLHDRIKMISILSAASGASGMCLGQELDLEAKKKKTSSALIERIHRYKTGALIRAAVNIGSQAAGKRSHQALTHLDRFATLIGLAFQAQDDILDVIGKNKNTGKRKGADQKLDKSTYPAFLGLGVAKLKARDLYQKSLACLESVAALGYDTTMLVALAHYVVERNK